MKLFPISEMFGDIWYFRNPMFQPSQKESNCIKHNFPQWSFPEKLFIGFGYKLSILMKIYRNPIGESFVLHDIRPWSR